jgi:hypothetical protein
VKTSEVLRKAADEIRRRGWHQTDYGSDVVAFETCAVCSLGAVNTVVAGDPFAWATVNEDRDLAIAALMRSIDDERVPDWNDTEGRTVEEVLDAFERAAQAAEGNDD